MNRDDSCEMLQLRPTSWLEVAEESEEYSGLLLALFAVGGCPTMRNQRTPERGGLTRPSMGSETKIELCVHHILYEVAQATWPMQMNPYVSFMIFKINIWCDVQDFGECSSWCSLNAFGTHLLWTCGNIVDSAFDVHESAWMYLMSQDHRFLQYFRHVPCLSVGLVRRFRSHVCCSAILHGPIAKSAVWNSLEDLCRSAFATLV